MIPFVQGVLITTDIAAKQIIMFLNEKNEGKIIIRELDETHLLIHAEWVNDVKEAVNRIFDQNYYERQDTA
jgi:hypothetical protein